MEERLGPGVELAEGSKGFVSKNKGSAKLIWVGDDGRLRLLVERRFTSLERLLEEILKTRAERIGVSKEVAEALKKNGRVVRGAKLSREAKSKAWLKEGLARAFSDTVGV